MMSRMLESKYLAGMQESGLPWHLLWFIGAEPVGINVSKRIGHAPSWSGASVDGKVILGPNREPKIDSEGSCCKYHTKGQVEIW